MRLLSVFPTEVQGDENPKFIICRTDTLERIMYE